MDFLIANTFTDSLGQLTNQEQKAVKTKAFDLQMNPTNPGFSFHRLDRVKDPDFWSVRVNRDIRLIVHRGDSRVLLCYVGHHDDAYDWAARRKIEQHPRTGAAQLVELRETQEQLAAEVEFTPETTQNPIIPDQITDDELQRYGVPEEWLQACRTTSEDTLFDIAEHLPQEAAEALIELATGNIPPFPEAEPGIADPFEHPDAKRRFRLMTNVEELAAALDSPWEKWAVFLHPTQHEAVENKYNGPARVAGSAGTGKTVVALHRARYLLQHNPDAQVLLTTFSRSLATALQGKLKQLLGDQPKLAERLSIRSMDQFALDLYSARFSRAKLVDRKALAEQLETLLESEPELGLPANYVVAEWWDVVDAWQLHEWDEYRKVRRLGRKLRIAESRREQMWRVFSALREWMQQNSTMTLNDVYRELAVELATTDNLPCDYVVVDEAQDISVGQLRLLAALSRKKDALFFAGDLGQRIFQTPFSWKSLGIDIRGRSKILRINYRTSHQIRRKADRLLPAAISDVDGNEEQRNGAISVFDGPEPLVMECPTTEDESNAVAQWLQECIGAGMLPDELCVIVRSNEQIERASSAAAAAGLQSHVLTWETSGLPQTVAISTMHQAKGLEFRAVAVMACDDEVLPLQQRLDEISDDSDLEEVYSTERHLLYVACTRARDRLLVTGVEPISDFCLDILS